MANQYAKPFLQPVSHGSCEVVGCQNHAKFRAIWNQGILVKLICTDHSTDVGTADFDASKFRNTLDVTRVNPLALLG